MAKVEIVQQPGAKWWVYINDVKRAVIFRSTRPDMYFVMTNGANMYNIPTGPTVMYNIPTVKGFLSAQLKALELLGVGNVENNDGI